MESSFAEIIQRAHQHVHFVVVSCELDDSLRALVTWHRVWAPRYPFLLRFAWFFVVGGLAVQRSRADLVHTMGAIIPNRVDLVAIHFCHAGYRATLGRWAAADASPVRRLNTGLSRRLAAAAEHWCYRPKRVRLMTAVATGLVKELSCHYPGVRVVLVPNAVDSDRFRPSASVAADIRNAHGVRANELVALFVGGEWARKRLPLAIQGVAAAIEAGADLSLWVVGPGDEERCRVLARREGLESRVHFFGKQEDVVPFCQGADIFLFPSSYETFSLATLEAASSALPLVLTPFSGVTELLRIDGGWICTEPTRESIGAALVRLASDSDLRRRMGQEARDRCAHLTWEAVVDRVQSLYDELMESSTRGMEVRRARPFGRPQQLGIRRAR